MKLKKISVMMAVILSVFLTACSNTKTNSSGNESTPVGEKTTETPSVEEGETSAEYPITIKHAFGETVIESKPERIATISWGNQDVPLALGVIPVGISEANYGVTDGSRLLPWTAEGFKTLGVENPVLFSDTDGLDYEAISDSQPDVILAAYSGITQDEYNLLSEIAPVVAYPTLAWQTLWRDQIVMDATGMGMKFDGEVLVAELEQLIGDEVAAYPQIAGKSAAFFYFNPSDLGKFYIYLPTDPRAAYLTDLGLKVPESVLEMEKTSDSFALEISAENVDVLDDIDIIIAYGDAALMESLQADSLVGTIPAVQRGSVVLIQDGTPLAASSTPSALSIPATIEEYLSLIGEAADKVK
ncbi:periplasmic binding protein [Anaerocolumna cellulosilytica]|uniref:Periplasmic binding protein n=1 Tax=Anaerocolumna cellulosilytica TaxID=433286 RepID=A0A6S6R449_9FIRM|nr:ABC transporter substrate-binding protein [Anaerocolumna cellulosilytica]MBB5195637.1 iron complex transport system substrate-binding protein [Anaerocolumna cellulosilytica]BCJ93881.1 periplasmic binding protein [Anaerocolumna cellulosilytica]